MRLLGVCFSQVTLPQPDAPDQPVKKKFQFVVRDNRNSIMRNLKKFVGMQKVTIIVRVLVLASAVFAVGAIVGYYKMDAENLAMEMSMCGAAIS